MPDDLSQKMESKIDAALRAKSERGRLDDGFDGRKVMNEVLDKPAMMSIYGMMNSRVISHVDGVVNAGKESVVFRAVGRDGEHVALKIYLVAASNFKRRHPYILGDPRFGRMRGGTRNVVRLWAQKEYRNLLQCAEAGIPAPRPIRVSGSVLAMEFVGSGSVPAMTLQESRVDDSDYSGVISIMSRMYRKARLVHGDMSGYNVFKTESGPVVFDLGSAVDTRHAGAERLLRRDIHNVTGFFLRRGIGVRDLEDAYREITG